MSITREETSLRVGSSISSLMRASGLKRREVIEVNLVTRLIRVLEIDRVDLQKSEYRSPSFGLRIRPSTVSPVRRPKRRICDGEM